jgi:hypothetical protein
LEEEVVVELLVAVAVVLVVLFQPYLVKHLVVV